MPKNKFYGHSILVKDGTDVVEWLREKNSNLQLANMVDPVFEGKYSVFTNDQTEARYLINPAMIDRLSQLTETYAVEDIVSVAFLDHRVFLLLPDKYGFFDAFIETPTADDFAITSFQNKIADLLGLIDHLEFYQPQQIARSG